MRSFARQALLWASVAALAVPTGMHAQFILSTNDGQITIAKYTGADGAVTIPSTTNGLPVTSIGKGACFSCTSLTDVTVGTNVTRIEDWAFYVCTSLTSVTIPSSVSSIGSAVFARCTSLTNVAIPNSVTSIGDAAFDLCTSLTSVTLPGSVTSIGSHAFSHCTAIAVDSGNPVYSSLEGSLLNKNQTMLIHYPEGGASDYTIPGSITSIGGFAFCACTSLTSVTVGNGVTNIGRWAFVNCASLTGVYFKGNVPRLEDNVFGGATNATIYHLPNTTGWGTTFGGRPTAIWNPQTNTPTAGGLQ